MATTKNLDTKIVQRAIRQRINSIEDQDTLNAILTLTEKCYIPKPLTATQLRDIEISRQQLTDGLGISHKDAMKVIDPEFQDEDEDNEN
ncbi:MAG: hypothetical protein LBG58_12820 [Planctomycetaceae bacterium]|jgi:uncharacterized protein YjiS (DUF1127 family)|nr:hypothetical protein [Planctomycetaceae bacterium]